MSKILLTGDRQIVDNQETLYERDFVLWIEDTVHKLQSREINHLDWKNLIEEISSLGRSERNEVRSRLRVLLTHLLKRIYIDLPENFRGWVDTIDEQRSELEICLQASPSLKNYFVEIFDDSWQYSLTKVRKDYPNLTFPDTWQFSREIDCLLTEIFW